MFLLLKKIKDDIEIYTYFSSVVINDGWLWYRPIMIDDYDVDR